MRRLRYGRGHGRGLHVGHRKHRCLRHRLCSARASCSGNGLQRIASDMVLYSGQIKMHRANAAHTSRLVLLYYSLRGRLSFVEHANDRVELDLVSDINLMPIKDIAYPLTVKRFFPMLVAEKPCIKARPAGMLRPLPFLLFLEVLPARPPRLGSVSSPESLSGGGGLGATIAFFARRRSRLSSKPVSHMGQKAS